MGFFIDLILVVGLLGLLLTYGLMSRGPARISRAGGAAEKQAEPDKLKRRYERFVRQAGLNPDSVGLSYWASKLFLACLLPLVLIVGSQGAYQWSHPLTVLLALLGFMLPDFWLLRARHVRRRRIRNALSFFLDLVVSLLHSGMTLERAFLRAARDGFSEPHPLADEARIIGWEMDAGKERSAAFETLADRTGVYELRAVSAALTMGLRRGAAVEDALEAQADTLRDRHRERALRRVSQAAVIAAMPVVLCGLPVFAVVVYFPGLIILIETIRALRVF
jgi:tight adherence protein C